MFRDSYVIYIRVMNILCTFHIFMYGYATSIYLSIRLYRMLLHAGLPDNIQCPHRNDVDKFMLVGQH